MDPTESRPASASEDRRREGEAERDERTTDDDMAAADTANGERRPDDPD